MIFRMWRMLPLLLVAAGLAFGGVVALERPADAQISVKCWREICVYDPDTRKTYCTREEIPCPEEQT